MKISKNSKGIGWEKENDINIEGGNIDLSSYAKKKDIPAKTSQLTNDSNFISSIPEEYITESELNTELSNKANTSDIPSLDGYATETYVQNKIAEASLSGGEVDLSGYATKDELKTKANKSDIPTKVSQLQNDSNFISSIPEEYVTEQELAAKGLATETFVTNKIAEASLSSGEVDLSGYATKEELNTKANKSDIPNLDGYALKTDIPTVPTKVSDLTNDSGFITEASMDDICIKKYINNYTINNMVINSNFDNLTEWLAIYTSPSVENNVCKFTATQKLGQIKQLFSLNINHVYYTGININSTSVEVNFSMTNSSGNAYFNINNTDKTENFSFISQIFKPTSSSSQLKVVDYRSSGWDEIQIKEVLLIDLSEIFGEGNEPSLDELEFMIKDNNNNNIFFNSSIEIRDIFLKNKDTQLIKESISKFIVRKNNNDISITYPYNIDNNITIYIQPNGSNDLINFKGVDFFNLNTKVTSSYKWVTDWLSPMIVKAVENIDGDLPDSLHFTGGNHDYSNGNSGASKTARLSNVKYFIDGEEIISNGAFPCDNLRIIWTNYIQATNTKKEDGTGREVLMEEYSIEFDGNKFIIENQLTALEQIVITTYYGMQATTNIYWNNILFYNSDNSWKNSNESYDASHNCNKITMKRNNDYLDLEIDSNNGLGTGDFIQENDCKVFLKNYGKLYFNLIRNKDLTLNMGETIFYRGYYKFYSR